MLGIFLECLKKYNEKYLKLSLALNIFSNKSTVITNDNIYGLLWYF